jgi:predicted transcriptional regulator
MEAVKKKVIEADSETDPASDVAARLLTHLSELGPQTIPDLLAATRVPLTTLLHALKDARDFQLVEMVGEHNLVQLTGAGNRTATVVRGNDIREQAETKLLHG